ncbi:MAG: tRNA pseudouridine(13) synthase TruD [Planctomycetes bacterium]|nr:tRNA pseudouridine(13) synthase TruD [Planctomycetota bacterium]
MNGIPHRHLTGDLPGVGGTIKQSLEDFQVHEVPLYYPADRGEHTYFEIEKSDCSTLEAVRRIARALQVPRGEIGYAGLKDRKAISRQVLSVRLVPPPQVLALNVPLIRVLWARLHGNKLRIGHLRGNRFVIQVRGIAPEAEARVRQIIEVLLRRGLPNYYGPQRFGQRAEAFRIGLALLLHEPEKAVRRILGYPSSAERHPAIVLARHRFMAGDLEGAKAIFPGSFAVEKRLLGYLIHSNKNYRGAVRRIREEIKRIYYSALQSYLFNRALDLRLELVGERLGKLLPGDIAMLHRNGAAFKVVEAAAEQPRADLFEISPSGPIFGKTMLWPEGAELEIEHRVLRQIGLRPTVFHQLMPGLHLQGARRPYRVEIQELRWQIEGRDLRLEFFLPKGAYATAFLREILKNDDPPYAFYSELEEEVPPPESELAKIAEPEGEEGEEGEQMEVSEE